MPGAGFSTSPSRRRCGCASGLRSSRPMGADRPGGGRRHAARRPSYWQGSATGWSSMTWRSMPQRMADLHADDARRVRGDVRCHATACRPPVTQADVEPITWAIIERGRSLTAIQHATDVAALRVLSREIAADLQPYDVPDADAHAEAAPARLLGHERAGHRSLQCEVERCSIHVPLQHLRPPAVSLPLHVGRQVADGRAGRRSLWR